MNNEKNNNFSTLISGIIIGAALTYLFGTKSGQKIKDELLEEAKKLIEKMGESLEEAKEDENHQVSEKLIEDFEKTQTQTNAGEAPPAPEHIEQLQKKGRRFFFKRHPHES